MLGCAEAASAYCIEALYSSLDGTYQYLQLRDARGPGQANPEYLGLTYGRYFLTASAPDVDVLDSGRIAGWTRTGQSLFAFDRGQGTVIPVGRYYYPTGDIGSHFFSASPDECSEVAQKHPEFVLETSAAFHIVLPDAVPGECPPDIAVPASAIVFIPIYRLWNNRPDTNHRYTMWPSERADMISKGWVSEGYGPMGVAMCALYWI